MRRESAITLRNCTCFFVHSGPGVSISSLVLSILNLTWLFVMKDAAISADVFGKKGLFSCAATPPPPFACTRTATVVCARACVGLRAVSLPSGRAREEEREIRGKI